MEAGQHVGAEEIERRREHAFRQILHIIATGHPDSDVVELPGGLLVLRTPVAPQRSLLNSVSLVDATQLIDQLDEVHALYEEAGVRAWTVWVEQPDANRALTDALAAAGHKLDAAPVAMGAQLDAIDLDVRQLPGGYEAGTCEWSEVGALNETAYGIEGGQFVAALGATPGDPRVRVRAVRNDKGRVVCVTVFVDDGEHISVWWVATHPDERGKGLATHLMQAGLAEGRDAGCTTTALEATAAGEPVYAKLGYTPYGPVEMWERRW